MPGKTLSIQSDWTTKIPCRNKSGCRFGRLRCRPIMPPIMPPAMQPIMPPAMPLTVNCCVHSLQNGLFVLLIYDYMDFYLAKRNMKRNFNFQNNQSSEDQTCTCCQARKILEFIEDCNSSEKGANLDDIAHDLQSK